MTMIGMILLTDGRFARVALMPLWRPLAARMRGAHMRLRFVLRFSCLCHKSALALLCCCYSADAALRSICRLPRICHDFYHDSRLCRYRLFSFFSLFDFAAFTSRRRMCASRHSRCASPYAASQRVCFTTRCAERRQRMMMERKDARYAHAVRGERAAAS